MKFCWSLRLAPCERRPLAQLAVLEAALIGVLAGVGCSSTQGVKADGGTKHPNSGAAVGSSCTEASQCDSPTSPDCLAELEPLASLGKVGGGVASIGITFPDGYCSSTLNCATNADCGTDGACFAPFRDVTSATLSNLAGSLGVGSGALDFLPAYGACLRSCSTSISCEPGQICAPPLQSLTSLIPGSINTTSFCIPDPSCPTEGCSALCNPNPCQNGGSCAVSGTSFVCTCAGGFTGSTCGTAPVDPIDVIGEACNSNGQCNVPGTPLCLSQVHPLQSVLPPTEYLSEVGLDFPHGYCSNEPNCSSDIDCGPQGGCLAPFRNVTAASLRGLEMSFNPPLTPGTLNYLGPYGVCLRSCSDSFDCFPDQACQLVMESFISQVPGAVNNQPYCVPQDNCMYCDPNAVCLVDSTGTGSCSCRPGYTGSGLVCTATGAGACASNPCLNGGTCLDGENTTYTCTCPAGLTGTNCENAPACTPNPCQNGGTCLPMGATSYMCDCAPGYTGGICETAAMCPALTNPTNGLVITTTSTPGSTASYECTVGYALSGNVMRTCLPTGLWSGTDPTCMAPCTPNPCENDGVCTVAMDGNASCDCGGTGYTGVTCASPVDCGALPALTNGTIGTVPAASTTYGTTATYACNANFTLIGMATRSCDADGTWSGAAPTCSATMDACHPNPCQNGGTCTLNGATASCACAAGYSGPDCATAVNCGAPSAPINGAVSATATTVGQVATYTCNAGYTVTGGATRTCQAAGTWSGAAPTCQCGTYTDIIYRTIANFSIQGTILSIGNQSFSGLVYNSMTPSWGTDSGSGDHGPFDRPPSVGSTTFTAGFIRLRYTNDANGVPGPGPVSLVEFYVPLIFTQSAGATVYCDSDYSLGIIDNTLSSCGDSDPACANHVPGLHRECAANAVGLLSGTTITWASCTSTSGSDGWNYGDARSATGAGCAVGFNAFGNTNSSSGLVPSSGKGDSYHTWNQALQNFQLSGPNPLTATITMSPMQVPNGTGQSNTWMGITGSNVLGAQCGTTPGTDLVCDVQ